MENPWTEEEDEKLYKLRPVFYPQWGTISSQMRSRTTQECIDRMDELDHKMIMETFTGSKEFLEKEERDKRIKELQRKSEDVPENAIHDYEKLNEDNLKQQVSDGKIDRGGKDDLNRNKEFLEKEDLDKRIKELQGKSEDVPENAIHDYEKLNEDNLKQQVSDGTLTEIDRGGKDDLTGKKELHIVSDGTLTDIARGGKDDLNQQEGGKKKLQIVHKVDGCTKGSVNDPEDEIFESLLVEEDVSTYEENKKKGNSDEENGKNVNKAALESLKNYDSE